MKKGRNQMISESVPSGDLHKISIPIMGKSSSNLQPS